jgi:hypothetical protein
MRRLVRTPGSEWQTTIGYHRRVGMSSEKCSGQTKQRARVAPIHVGPNPSTDGFGPRARAIRPWGEGHSGPGRAPLAPKSRTKSLGRAREMAGWRRPRFVGSAISRRDTANEPPPPNRRRAYT